MTFPRLTRRQQTAALVILALAVRLLFVLIATDNIDVQNYRRVADQLAEQGIYAIYVQTPGIYPYPPVWMWAEMIGVWLADLIGGSYSFWVRAPIVLADVLIVGILAAWQTKGRRPAGLRAALFYAVNPVAILVTCLHGQFDAIPISFLLMAAYWLLLHDRIWYTGWALAVAVAVKGFPVLMLPSFAACKQRGRDRLIIVGLAFVTLLLLLLPYAVRSPAAILHELFGYRGAALLGLLVPVRSVYVPLLHSSFPVPLTEQILSASTYLFLLAYLAYTWWMWRRGAVLLLDIIGVFALFYVLYAGIAPQYTLWVLPFLLLANLRLALIYTASATLALVGFYLYAVPNTLSFWDQTPRLAAQILYAVGGSLWWLTALGLLVWAIRTAARKTAASPTGDSAIGNANLGT